MLFTGDIRSRRYIASAGQTRFAMDFWVGAQGDVKIYVNDVNTAFTLEDVVNAGSLIASATAVLSPRAMGDVINIVRASDPEQRAEFPPNGRFSAEALNDELARLWMAAQEAQDDTRTALDATLRVEDAIAAIGLPSIVLESGTLSVGNRSLTVPSRILAAAGTIPADVTRIEVLGFAAAGDGGAALYTEIADTGILQPWQFRSNASTRRWQLADAVLRPEMFGTTSGVVDSTPFIQAAIDMQAARGGGTVLLAQGSYYVTQVLHAANVVVRGLRDFGTAIRPMSLFTTILWRITGTRAVLADLLFTADALYVQNVTWPAMTAVQVEAAHARIMNLRASHMATGLRLLVGGGHFIFNVDMRRMRDFYFRVGGGTSGQVVAECVWVNAIARTDFAEDSIAADANKGVGFHLGSGAANHYLTSPQATNTAFGLVCDDDAGWGEPTGIFLSGTPVIEAPLNEAVRLVRCRRFSLRGARLSSRAESAVFVGGLVSTVTLDGNEIVAGGKYGVVVATGARFVRISDSTIAHNGRVTVNAFDGVLVEAGAEASISGNVFRSDGWNGRAEQQRYGVWARIGAMGDLSGNLFTGNQTGGALIDALSSTFTVRGNVGAQAPADTATASLLFSGAATSGFLRNPRLTISQEALGSLVVVSPAGVAAVDQVICARTGTMTATAQMVANPFPGAAGFRRLRSSLRTTIGTAQAVLAAGDGVTPYLQPVEGLMVRHLGWGTADARAIQVLAIVSATVAGTYGIAARNGATNRSYVTTVTLPALTPTAVLVTIPGDVAGTWIEGNVLSLFLSIGVVTGVTAQATTLNAWVAGNFTSHASVTNWAGTAGAAVTVAFADAYPLGVLPWTTASEVSGEALARLLNQERPAPEELALCQRYWRRDVVSFMSAAAYAAEVFATPVAFPVEMRTAPALIDGGGGSVTNLTSVSFDSATASTFRVTMTASAVGTFAVTGRTVVASARM